jgi:hypothetical protein
VTTPASIIAEAFVIGLISGLLDSFFINVNFRINVLRGAHKLTSKRKLLGAFV